MRHMEPGELDRARIAPKDVEVDDPGAPPNGWTSVTPQLLLYAQERIQQLRRRERSLDAKRPVEVLRLRWTNGFGLVQGRARPDAKPIHRIEQLARCLDGDVPRSEIRSYADDRNHA